MRECPFKKQCVEHFRLSARWLGLPCPWEDKDRVEDCLRWAIEEDRRYAQEWRRLVERETGPAGSYTLS